MRDVESVVLIGEPAAKCLVVGYIESLVALVDWGGEEGGQGLAYLVDLPAVDEAIGDWVELLGLFGEEGLLFGGFDEGE